MAKQGKLPKNIGKQRIYEVYKALVEMNTTADIKKTFSEKWDCSEQNIDYYIKKAY